MFLHLQMTLPSSRASTLKCHHVFDDPLYHIPAVIEIEHLYRAIPLRVATRHEFWLHVPHDTHVFVIHNVILTTHSFADPSVEFLWRQDEVVPTDIPEIHPQRFGATLGFRIACLEVPTTSMRMLVGFRGDDNERFVLWFCGKIAFPAFE